LSDPLQLEKGKKGECSGKNERGVKKWKQPTGKRKRKVEKKSWGGKEGEKSDCFGDGGGLASQKKGLVKDGAGEKGKCAKKKGTSQIISKLSFTAPQGWGGS